MSSTLRAKIGDHIDADIYLTGEHRINIHLIAGEKGFDWKITQSKIIEVGNIKKWEGVDKSFVFKFGDNDPEVKERLDRFLLSAGVEGDAKEKFENEMIRVRDTATLRWAAGRFGKER